MLRSSAALCCKSLAEVLLVTWRSLGNLAMYLRRFANPHGTKLLQRRVDPALRSRAEGGRRLVYETVAAEGLTMLLNANK